MKLVGTKFQLKVWAYLRKIPRGSVKTYSQVAKAIGKPLAVRAVATDSGDRVVGIVKPFLVFNIAVLANSHNHPCVRVETSVITLSAPPSPRPPIAAEHKLWETSILVL